MSKIKISDILHQQFKAAGDTQWANGNEGIDAVYTVNRRWLNNYSKLLVEAVVDKCAEEAEITYEKEKTYDFTFVDKQSILKVKQEISYDT